MIPHHMTPAEHCSEQGAATLANRIRYFWQIRGVQIQTWIEMIPVRADYSTGSYIYGVRSKFPNGFPYETPQVKEAE